jgi:quinol monooxygenase YgiN
MEHVRRSRTEPGCLSHALHQDAEDPCQLFFFERWADRAALNVHFAVPESAAFVQALAALTTAPPEMVLYEAVAL